MSNASQLDQLGTPRSFLNEVYQVLGYEDGALLNAVKVPESGTYEDEEWLNKGDWLALAKKAGAEKVFFVNDDPVLVFCEFQHIPNDAELLDTFRRIWCMARPQCLFIAMPDVLRVYRLNQPPAKNIRTLHEREI